MRALLPCVVVAGIVSAETVDAQFGQACVPHLDGRLTDDVFLAHPEADPIYLERRADAPADPRHARVERFLREASGLRGVGNYRGYRLEGETRVSVGPVRVRSVARDGYNGTMIHVFELSLKSWVCVN